MNAIEKETILQNIHSSKNEKGSNKRFNIYNLDCIADMELTNRNNVPIVKATHSVPDKIISFNHALLPETDKNCFIHFFIDDYQFDRVWRNPARYLPILSKFQGIIAPDFSLYTDMPIAVQRWNIYRNRFLAAYYAKAGIDVIPSAGWSDERSYSFCFEGLPKYSTVAISTNGCLSNKVSLYYFAKGFNRMIETLKPTTILCYGRPVKHIFDTCKTQIIQYQSYSQELKRRLG